MLLTETNNPSALKWLNKNDEVGMPTAIQNVVNKVAELRQSTPEDVTRLVHTNFSRLIAGDFRLKRFDSLFAPVSSLSRV